MGFYLGRYDCLEPIGDGALGETFRAKMHGVAGSEKQFAVKRIHETLSADPSFVERLMKAGTAAAALGHEKINPIHEVGSQGTRWYVAADLARGIDLGHLLAGLRERDEAITADSAIILTLDVLEALAYAHGRKDLLPNGVLHLALSPRTVMVSPEGDARLLDTGLFAALAVPGWAKDEHAATLAWVAPEVADGAAADPRADVFSVGALLHLVLSGSQPFAANNAAEVRRKQMAGPPAPPACDGRLQAAIQKALQPDPAARFPSVVQLAEAIRALLSPRANIARGDLGMLARRLSGPPPVPGGKALQPLTVLEVEELDLRSEPINLKALLETKPAEPELDLRSAPVNLRDLLLTKPPDPEAPPPPPPQAKTVMAEAKPPAEIKTMIAEAKPIPLPPIKPEPHPEATTLSGQVKLPDVKPAEKRTMLAEAPSVEKKVPESKPAEIKTMMAEAPPAEAKPPEAKPAEARTMMAEVKLPEPAPAEIKTMMAEAPLGDAKTMMAQPAPEPVKTLMASAPYTPADDAPPPPPVTMNIELPVLPGTSQVPVVPGPAPNRRRVVIAAGAGVAALVSVGLWLVLTPSQPQPPPPKPAPPVVATPTPKETPKPVETAKPVEPPKTVVAKVETPKPETPKPETPKSVVAKVETPKPETPKPETPKPVVAKVETPKPETPKPVVAKVETPKPETEGAASLQLTTTPPGAQLYVDGEPKGASPLQLQLTPGRHKVVAMAERSKLKKEELHIKGATELSWTLEPAKTSGTGGLKVRCAKTKGELRILVDGADTGLTCPNDVRINVEPGEHTVGLYSPRTDKTVEVHAEVKDDPDHSTRVYTTY